jgi:protein-disulfide isomerase
MKFPFLPLLAISLLLAACVSREGLSAASMKPPRGNPQSSLVLEEYGDLQCPACQGAHDQIVKPLLQKYGSIVRYEFRHFPIRSIHAYAQEAAEAAECAADQGKFWEFVDDVYRSPESQKKLTRSDHSARIETLGIADLDLFRRCLKSRIKRDAVQREFDEGKNRGVQGTPTFFVAGKKVERNNLEEISKLIEERLGAPKL